MRVLYFHSVAGHPKVISALMGQATNVLRPFNRFLGQAIHTAKQRQFRYQLPWEKVRNLRSFRLHPMDTMVRVEKPKPSTVLVDWPSDVTPDLTQPGFVTNRSVQISFEEVAPHSKGLKVTTDSNLEENDNVIWCQQTCEVVIEGEIAPPESITTIGGEPIRVVSPPRSSKDNLYWLLSLEGKHQDGDLLVDGEELWAETWQDEAPLKQATDEKNDVFDVSGHVIRSEEAPAKGTLIGDDGLRYTWNEIGSKGRSGCWVQLLPPEEADGEEFLDPRAAFCEGDVREVWTQKFRRDNTVFRVKKVDQDRYQLLLDRFPPEQSTLYLPVDIRNLYLQKRALRQLLEAPLPHHQGLLRLCEDPEKARWPQVKEHHVSKWYSLKDETRSGTDQQRTFVRKALGSPDFAFLEGPPGSGKTTAICEIVQQLILEGKKVLLCASTHVAIDNVLERLLDGEIGIDAIRIGRLERVDDNVQDVQLDSKVEALVSKWRAVPSFSSFGDAELQEMAERTLIMAANLTCGTTMGIVNHPLFQGRDQDVHISERPISTMPHWDVLIVDEASKTLIQEFMVPALMAKKWIVVGDVRQLPPFADRADIVANLRDLVNENDKPLFPPDHQRACLIRYRLKAPKLRNPGVRWLIVERPGVLEWLCRELEAKPDPRLSVVRVSRSNSSSNAIVESVTIDQLRSGAPASLSLVAADWVLVSDDLLEEAAPFLPGNLLLTRDITGAAENTIHASNKFLLRQQWWLERAGKKGQLEKPYKERKFRGTDVTTFRESEECEQDWLSRNDLGQEVAWRITRLHELKRSRNDREKKRLRQNLEMILPNSLNLDGPVSEIEDIGLPSILEVLQEGIGADRANRRSALTAGLKTTQPQVFSTRFESLSFQHRMHPEISSFSREIIYQGEALHDANTIQSRDESVGWDYSPYKARRVWIDVHGRENKGENQDEIRAMQQSLQDFFLWVKKQGSPQRELPRHWEVACLCFYVKQERVISDMLSNLTGDHRKTRFRHQNLPIEIVCGTVDRFQGREADLVLLSMRNTRRVGFLDSPNRLNVGVTRARQQLIVFGNHNYFLKCGIGELEELAR